MQQTSERIDERRNILEGAGAFRTPVRQAFRQGYRPRWSGEIHHFDKAEGAQVTDTQGRTYDTRLVQPVDARGGDIEIRQRAKAATESAERQRLAPFRPLLVQYMHQKGGSVQLQELGQYMRQQLKMPLAQAGVAKALRTLDFEVYKGERNTYWARLGPEEEPPDAAPAE